jgi:HEPN domain-containing protein
MPADRHREWVKTAEEDLQTIQAVLILQDVPWRVVAYHAQQAAEKYLKAFLISRGWRLKKTHDLVELNAEAKAFVPELAVLDGECANLNGFIQAGRYPISIVTETDARMAVVAAERIRTEILKLLP